ncbi:MAG: Lipopolysaccharide core heptosyltransferase RfaQ [Candidatus Omnitrophica bacterium ADurb.Bin277]|nr:MAG: Lipopolysaccharide core heptosyltransferase RfaQ [Candidatus Omnitrophica bacterium ADurb.Bin277]
MTARCTDQENMKSIRLSGNPRILVTRTDRIGDLVLTTPVLKALRGRFPKAWIAALVFIEHRDIVRGNPYIDEVILYDKKGSEKTIWGQILFAGTLRKKRFDLAVHCHATNRVHLAALLAGIPVRIGYDRRSPWALTHVHPYDKKLGQRHEAEYLFDLLEPLGISMPARLETFVPVTERSRDSLRNLLFHLRVPNDMPWIVLSPAASDVTKMWPAEKFAELAAKLGREMKCVFLAIGSEADRPVVESLREKSPVPVIDLGGRLTLGMLGVLLKRSRLLVSNDSGPVHIASAVGCPVVSIFGRYEAGLGPNRWKPIGRACRIVAKDVSGVPEPERKFTYIDQITVQEVCSAARDLLEETGREGIKT